MKILAFFICFTAFIPAQEMNPDGYVGGLTLSGFYFLHLKSADSFYDKTYNIGEESYSGVTHLDLLARFPVQKSLTVSVYLNYYADKVEFLPSSLGRSFGFYNQSTELSSYTVGVGVTYYMKSIF